MTSVKRCFLEADDTLESFADALNNVDAHAPIVEIFETLRSMYETGCEPTRYKIVCDLVELEYTGARPLLRTALVNDVSGLVRHEAAFGLGILGSSADADVLIRGLQNDPDPMVRHEAAIALGIVGDST